MSLVRLIPRLDIKGPNLVKGIHLEGLRVLGNPNEFALKYYREGADELLFIDIVASLYGRDNMLEIISKATKDIFIPITVGGGLRSVDDVRAMLRAGADKVALNTAATRDPKLISELATQFGSQCVVLSVEAQKRPDGTWEAFTDNGRERTGRDVIEWVKEGEKLGAGEILVTAIHKEGTRKGFDLELISAISKAVSIPVIASGGMGSEAHLVDAVRVGGADAVAMAAVLHYKQLSLSQIRAAAGAAGISVRSA